MVKAAHNHSLLTIAHALSLEDTLLVLNDGCDGLSHTLFNQAPLPDLIAAYKNKNAFCIATLDAIVSLTGEAKFIAEACAHDKRIAAMIE